jgi:hypothetical protein
MIVSANESHPPEAPVIRASLPLISLSMTMVEGTDDRLATVLYGRPPIRHLHIFTKMPPEPRKFQYMSAFVGKQHLELPVGLTNRASLG